MREDMFVVEVRWIRMDADEMVDLKR